MLVVAEAEALKLTEGLAVSGAGAGAGMGVASALAGEGVVVAVVSGVFAGPRGLTTRVVAGARAAWCSKSEGVSHS